MYKRQVRAGARALREQRGALEARLAAGEGDAWALRLELARLKEELADCAHRLKAVSYTHLDVYKRQDRPRLV